MLFHGFEQPGVVNLKRLLHPGGQVVVLEVVVLDAGAHFEWQKAGIAPPLSGKNVLARGLL